MVSKILNNRAETINIRRETVGMELTAVHGAIRLLESIVVHNLEENNEAIAILQSVMEQQQSAKSQSDLKKSESDLSAAKTLLEEWTGLGDVIGQLTVTKDGKQYRLKSLEGDQQSSAAHLNACMTMLNYSLKQLKVSNLLAEELAQTPENSQQAAAVANIPSIPVCSEDRSLPTPRPSLEPSVDHQLFVSLQFSNNGDLKPQIVIQLFPQEAPQVSS